jgi:hypothetical protein
MAAHDDAIDVLQAGCSEDRLRGEAISHLQRGLQARQGLGTGDLFQIANCLGMSRLDSLFGLLGWLQEGCHGIDGVREDP